MDIRERIIELRNTKGMSMQSFADTIGVSVGVIKNIEYDKAPVTNVVCNAICYKFHIREEWLMEGTGDMYQAEVPEETMPNGNDSSVYTPSTTVSERFFHLRKSLLNLSMRKFVEPLGVSIGVVQNIESGLAPMTRPFGIAVCTKYGVREEWLFDGIGDVFEKKQHSNDDQIHQLSSVIDAQNPLTLEEARIIFLYRRSPDPCKRMIRVALESVFDD